MFMRKKPLIFNYKKSLGAMRVIGLVLSMIAMAIILMFVVLISDEIDDYFDLKWFVMCFIALLIDLFVMQPTKTAIELLIVKNRQIQDTYKY